jgi:hypothetical protein
MPFVAHRVFGWTPVEIDDSWGLRTISKGHAYSICNSVTCVDCGMLFLDIRFSDAEMSALYTAYRGPEYTALREIYEPGYTERNEGLNAGVDYLGYVEEFLSSYVPLPVRLLDWGGDTGRNTPFHGSSSALFIYDISDKPVMEGAVRVDRQTALSASYDLIVCSNVLEHVPYPADLIMDMRQAMGKETILYIEVPHEEIVRLHGTGPDLGVHKKHWHEHVNFFSEVPLRRLLETSGLEILGFEELISGAVRQLMIACRLRP